MTDSGPSPAQRPPTWLSVLMILIGIILLLPGACAAYFVVGFSMDNPKALFSDPQFVLLWLVCFGIAAGGIALIRVAVRRLRAGA